MSNNIIFSFDIGNTSIGWSVTDINYNTLNLNLLLTGVRLFNEASVGAQNKNINLARRTARLARKRGARKSKRKLIVKSLLQNKLKWFTKNDLDHNNKDNIFNQLIKQAEHNNCYLIRVKGLTQKLSKVEIACALFHMAKYRGYIDSNLVSTSTTQDANVKKEEATIKNAIDQLSLKYGHLNCHVERVVQSVKYSTQIIEQEKSKLNTQESNNYICAGRACYHNKQIVSKDSKGNYVKKPNYQHTIENKNIVEVEIPTFFATQSQYYPELTAEIQQQFIDIVKWKAEPKSFNIGNCPLIEGEKVTSVHAISFLKFKLLSLLLNVRIMQNDEEYNLNKTEIINIFNEIINDTKLEIKYNHLEKFIINNTNYNNFTFKGIASDDKLSSKKFISFASVIKLKNICPTITDNEIDIIYNIALKDSNNIKNIFNNIQNNAQLSATVKQDIKLKQNEFNKLAFSGTVAYCSTAYNQIFNEIWQEINNTSTALPNKFNIQSFIDKLYPKVEQKAENNFLPDIFNPNITQPFRYFLPNNPSIIRVINEFRKLYNELVNRFGAPKEVKLELLRELKNPKAKDNYIKIRNQNEQANIEAKAQHGDALKGRLYNEQGGKCLYCNTQLNPNFSNTQVDHILPYSVTFDDSFNNKTLCCTACNQNKGKKTPYKWLNKDNKWENFKTTINNTSTLKNNKKINNYLTTKDLEDLIEGFSNRSLNDSSYASKLIKDYIAQYSNVKTITPSTGMLTSFWRKFFGLKKYRDIKDCATHLQNTVFNFIVKDNNAPQEIKNILQNTKTLANNLYNAKAKKNTLEKELKDDTKVFTEADKKVQKNEIDELDKKIKALTTNHQQYKVEFTKYIIQNDNQGGIFSLLQDELNEFKVNNHGKADDDTNIIFTSVETQNIMNDYARSLLNNTNFINKIAIILINWVGNMHHAVDACLIALNNSEIITAVSTEFGKLNLNEETNSYKPYLDQLIYTLGSKIITDANSYNALKNYKQQIINQVTPQALLIKQKYKTVKLLKSNNNASQIGILAKPDEKDTINTLKTVSKKVNQSISGGLHKETIHTKKEIKNKKDSKDESTIYVVNNGLASADKVVRTDLYKLTTLLKHNDKNKNSKIDTKQVLRAIKLADIYLPVNRSHGNNKNIILPEYNNLSSTNTWLLNGKLNQNDLAITSNNKDIINTLYAYHTAGKLTLNALQTYYQNNDIVGLAMHCNFIANTHKAEITNLKATINNKAKCTKLLKESQNNTATPSVINNYANLFTDLHALTLSTANFMFSLQSYNIVSYTANAKSYYIEYRSYHLGHNQIDYRNIKFNSGQAYLGLNTLSNLKKHTVDLLGFVSRGITKENLDTKIFNKQTALVNNTLQQNIANIINQGGQNGGL